MGIFTLSVFPHSVQQEFNRYREGDRGRKQGEEDEDGEAELGDEAASEYEKTHVDEPYVGGMVAHKSERGSHPCGALNGEEDSDHRHEEPRINQCGCTYADASKGQEQQ